LFGTALLSFACSRVRDLDSLIVLRALHGAVAAGPAVFAPGIAKALFDERGAVRAIGALGSIEALAPAIAPLIGAWLLSIGGWTLSFLMISGLAVLIALVILCAGQLPRLARRQAGSYRRLLGDPVFLRYMLSQSLVVGGLLVFVFGMPAVFVHAFGGELRHFIVMQVCGIAGFMLAANLAGHYVHRLGAERLIVVGSAVAALGAALLLAYAAAGGRDPWVITALFVPVNTGLGIRGPSGFYRAILASKGDDARGAALVILGMLGAAALGTALAAPTVAAGFAPLAATALVMHGLACLCLLLPRLR
jgi:DHA1 family bicyclomycin/chloramphenicol resistance-like MFS transporter